jgi:phage tail-like protein
MNVNGSRFQLLLGRDDWGRCLDGDGRDAMALATWWDAPAASPPVDPPEGLPAWDGMRGEITLGPRRIDLPATPAETPLSLASRRAASADRNGNVYRIGDDRRTLVVCSAGTRHESIFWPAEPADCDDAPDRWRRDFQPAAPAPQAGGDEYRALAVTADDYLVVAFARGPGRGFLAFDLVAGGPPVPTAWPDAVPLEPFDMAPREAGGAWLLDRDNAKLWELDCRLAVVRVAQPEQTLVPAELDDFQPLDGATKQRPATLFAGGIDLRGSPPWAMDPVAVETLGENAVLLLDLDLPTGRSRVVRLRRDAGAWSADASHWLDELPDTAYDFVLATARLYQRVEAQPQLFIATAGGNQARAYTIGDAPGNFALGGAIELFPLRRFGGRALVAIRGAAFYDSGIEAVVWTPIVQQPRTLFESRAELVTPVFDSFEIGTTWDRVVLDACLPADTSVAIESRAGDEIDAVGSGSPSQAAQVIGSWMAEPAPILRSDGAELAWLRSEAARRTRRENGVGSWDLLLQKAQGRYLQLRIVLESGNGIATPRLRALRVWSPRFSYPQRFLPAIYREDATAAPFLERWLANIENTLTNIEDRVVNVQALFDPRIVPAETLPWLASWFDVAFDPAWDAWRQRLFVRRAMDYFRWRGTVHGLRLALELAFDPCIRDAAFDDPVDDSGIRAIRIVEAYQARIFGALAAGDPQSTEPGPRVVQRGALWTPQEGNAGLADRYATQRGVTPTFAEQVAPFPLVARDTDDAAQWAAFWQSSVGFVPSIGSSERARWRAFLAALGRSDAGAASLPPDWPPDDAARADWRAFVAAAGGASMRALWLDFLARRYRSVERLDRAWHASWPSFDLVALPDVLPETAAAQADWLQFEGEVLAMHRTAHRFSVLLPLDDVTTEPDELERRLGLARRIVELEKPAHTVFDVRFYWAFFRVGEARLGLDTQMGSGSRARELVPEAILGRAYVGASFVGGPERPTDGDRLLAAC